MTKDEARLSVMGAISMALKDPTLQQGFEIICKNLKELEKKNERLNICKFEMNKMLEESAEENAELKETLKTYNGCGDWDNDFHTCRVYLQHEELQAYIHQLTKAKEIIKELLILAEKDNREYEDVYKKAEQFLSEVEK